MKIESIKPVNAEYILSIGMDYLREKNGVPRVQLAHQEMFLQHNISYIGIFPVRRNIPHTKTMLFCMYGVIIDGNYLGVYQINQILRYLFDLDNSGFRMVNIHLHHLINTKWKTVRLLIDAFSNVPIKVYLHDYYYACLDYNLLCGGRKYCGGNGFGTDACKECPMYEQSKKYLNRLIPMLKDWDSRTTYISPSECTKHIYSVYYPEYSDKILVIPHQTLIGHCRENLKLLKENDVINVAFVGTSAYNKGWETWEKLIKNVSKDKYKFIVFNSSDAVYNDADHVNVAFSTDNLNAMTDALKENDIHIALLWSVWPETYAYTCHESYAANAYIVTNNISGNIRDTVEKNRCGLVLNSEEELFALFNNRDALAAEVNMYREMTPGGPELLQENDEIVDIVEADKHIGGITILNVLKKYHWPTNAPFLWLLNKHRKNKYRKPLKSKA